MILPRFQCQAVFLGRWACDDRGVLGTLVDHPNGALLEGIDHIAWLRDGQINRNSTDFRQATGIGGQHLCIGQRLKEILRQPGDFAISGTQKPETVLHSLEDPRLLMSVTLLRLRSWQRQDVAMNFGSYAWWHSSASKH